MSIDDTLEHEPTLISEADPKKLNQKFKEELERRGKNIRAMVRVELMPKDTLLIPEKQRRTIAERCDQVPVFGYNCGCYGLTLIEEHFAELLADTTAKFQVGKTRTPLCSCRQMASASLT